MRRDAPDLSVGIDALRSREWAQAKEAFSRALKGEESAEAFEGLGLAAWWFGDTDETIASRERAYQLYRYRQDALSAARLATWLGYDAHVLRGNPAVGAGWFARARRLLHDAGDVAERGWLAFREGEIVLQLHHDPLRALALGDEAMELGRRLGDVDLEMVGLSLRGLALVTTGDVPRGMHCLDEATAAAVAGEIAVPNAAGNVCCHLIYACERVHDYSRAAQWCDVVTDISDRWGIRGLFGICRAHYARVLIWRGNWAVAESELTTAAAVYAATAPALSFEAHLGLAELRRRQGRLEEASSLCTQFEWNPFARLCLGEIALERGEFARAAELVERHLRALPPEARLSRAPGLDLAARVHVATGEIDEARSATESLRALAAEVDTPPLRASASVCSAMVSTAQGLADLARRELEDAVDLWSRSDAPFEEANTRIALGRVMLELGHPDAASREGERARGILAGLGAGRALERARALLAAVEDGSVRADEVLSAREREVLRLVADGLGDQEIAMQLVLSHHTVHRHVANIRTKLREPSRAAAAAHAIRAGLI